MKIISSILLLVALVCVASAIEKEDGVYVLTKDNFDSFIKEDGVSLIEFYAPWCGHCKKLTPEYAKAAATLSTNDPVVRLAKVDCTVETELGSKYGVTGYPTLKVFRGGKDIEYKGPREANGIVSYMKKQSEPSIRDIKTVADLEKFIAEEAGVVFFGDASSKLSKTFETAATGLREQFRFARTEAKEVLEKLGHANEVVFFQSKRYAQSPLEAIKAVYKEGTATLDDFIRENLLPLVGEMHQDNAHHYDRSGKPVVKVYSDLDWKLNSKGANYLLNRIRKIAKEFKDKVIFAVSSKGTHQKELEDAGLKGDLPFAIHDFKKGHKYPGPAAFSPENLKKHLEDYLAEKLEPYVKSEPVPESQTPGEPVVVTGRTFDKIVMDPTKDVLLEIYAPWCGHCKTLEPKYKDLATKMQGFSNSLVIAKIDGTANDIPPAYTAKGFPTIFFAPANNKENPLSYDGQREVKDFVSYIKKNAHLPLTKASSDDAKDKKHDEL